MKTKLLVAFTFLAACSTAKDEPRPITGYAHAGGLDYYYEVHGEGAPLLLLHGGLGSIDMFGPVLTDLAKDRQVIAVDLQGHGRTALGDRPLALEAIADDLAGVLDHLGYDQVDTVGYSFGGGVALRLAVQHPDRVRRLVIASAGYSSDAFYPELKPLQAGVNAAAAPMMKDTPMYKSYVAVAPNPDDFPRLLDAIGAFMLRPFDYAEDVKRVGAKTLLVVGDSDMIRLDHVVAFYNLLGGGLRDAGWAREHQAPNRLAVLPDVTHYDMFLAPGFATTIRGFLDDAPATKSWAQHVAE